MSDFINIYTKLHLNKKNVVPLKYYKRFQTINIAYNSSFSNSIDELVFFNTLEDENYLVFGDYPDRISICISIRINIKLRYEEI